MATIVRDKIKQPNGKDFKLLDAVDVEYTYVTVDESGNETEHSTSVQEYLSNLNISSNEPSEDKKIPIEFDYFPTRTLNNFELDYIFDVACFRHIYQSSFYPILGRTYQIAWDGTTFKCETQDGSALQTGLVILGNNFNLTGEEPFIIGFANGYATVVSTVDTEPTAHTLRIYTEGEAVANYEQNDINGEGYIHNRPFYQTNDMRQMLSVSNVDFYYDGFGNWERNGTVNSNFANEWTQPWKHARVTWDGVEYICEPITMDGEKYFGETSIATSGEVSNLPFLFTVTKNSNNEIVWYCDDIENMNTTPKFDSVYIGTMPLITGNNIKYATINAAIFSINDMLNRTQYKVQIESDISYHTIWSGIANDNSAVIGIGNPNLVGISTTDGNANANFVMYVKIGENTTWLYFDSSTVSNPSIRIDKFAPITHTFNVEIGDYSVKTIDPKFLPGALLPPITTSDNGKIIEVVNGKYVLRNFEESSLKIKIDEYMRSMLGTIEQVKAYLNI